MIGGDDLLNVHCVTIIINQVGSVVGTGAHHCFRIARQTYIAMMTVK